MGLPFKIPFVDPNWPRSPKHTINDPQVFTNDRNAITSTLVYLNERRMPQPNLIGASGRNNSAAIQVSTASAGAIEQVTNSQGVVQSFLRMTERPLDV